MRNAIRTHLLTSIEGIQDIYEPHAASADSKPPYLVIRQGVDTDENDWLGFRRVVEVWPYVNQTTFSKIDDLEKKIVKSLDKKLITDNETGEVFSCLFLGSAGQDVVDREWNVITRGLRFAVMALQPVAINEQVSSDPWIDALSSWTKEILEENWSVYQNRFPLGYARPSVLWRLNNFRVLGVNRSAFEVRKEIVGHVLGSSPNEQLAATTKIIQQAVSAIKIPLDVTKKTFMTVVQPQGNYQSDGLNSGQITLTLTRKTSRPTEEVPFMQEINSSGSWR